MSFCLADTTIDSWLRKGDGPRTYFAPGCLFPASVLIRLSRMGTASPKAELIRNGPPCHR